MKAGPRSHAVLWGQRARCSLVSPGAAGFPTSLLGGEAKWGPGRWRGPVGTQDKIAVGWILSFCPANTVVIPTQCSGHGLFSLARHLGRAVSLPVVVSNHLFLASTAPSRALGLSGAGGKGHAGMGDPYP